MMKNKLIFVFLFCFVVTLSVFAQSKEARKVDEFSFNINCCESKAKVDEFGLALHNSPGSTGYIVFYEGKSYPTYDGTKLLLPRRNEAQTRIKEFLEDYQVSERLGGNVKIIDGGYRENYTIEFWVVPKEAAPPLLTPTVKPENIKFRKGKYRISPWKDC